MDRYTDFSLRRGSAATGLLRLRVQIPPGTWTSTSCECCVVEVIGSDAGNVNSYC
jgi:hypothetical protein